MVKNIKYLLICILSFIAISIPLQALEIDTDPSWKNEDLDWTSKIILADINNDGYLDMVVANYIRGKGYTKDNRSNIKIYINRKGIFENVASQVIEMKNNIGSWNIALGDYDNDGDLDLALGNVFEKRDMVLENHEGVFREKPVWVSDDKSVSHGLDWVDYDNDGDLDLSVSAAYSGVKLYENSNGIISVRAKWESYEVLDFQDVDWIDMDNDGDLDLAVSNNNARPPGGIFIYKSNNGELPSSSLWVPDKAKKYLPLVGVSSIRTVSWKTLSIKYPGTLAWGDIDNDGYPDLAVSNGDGPTMVFKNIKGGLQKKPFWKSSDKDSSFDLLFADIDNDGLVKGTVLLSGVNIKNVIYFPQKPIHKIKSIIVDSDIISKDEYCYNLKDGWISFNRILLKDAEKITIDYTYSTDIDLIVAKSTWQGKPEEGKTDKIYLNKNGVLSTEAGWQTAGKTLSNAVAVGDVDNDGDVDIVFGGMVGWDGKTEEPQHIYLYKNRTVDNKE